MSQHLEDLRVEYRELVNSLQYGYALGHSRTLGRDPRLERLIARADELRRQIADLEREPE